MPRERQGVEEDIVGPGKRVMGIVGGVILAIMIGSMVPALAASASWGPVSSYYGGVKRVTGSGKFYNSVDVVKSQMTITDNAPNDGNTVYGSTWFWRYDFPYWVVFTEKSTPEWSSGTHTWTLSVDYANWGSMAKGEFYVCAQMGWPVPDSCSDAVFRYIDW